MQQHNILKHFLFTNLSPNLIFIISTNAAGVVEQRAGEWGRLSTVWTVAAQLQGLLTIDHTMGVSRGSRQVRTVEHHTCMGSHSSRNEWKKVKTTVD